MPSMDRNTLATALEAGEDCIAITNKFLSDSPHAGYVYSAKLDTSFAGRVFEDGQTVEEAQAEMNTWDVTLPPKSKAVIFNHLAIEVAMSDYHREHGVHYYTVNEITTGNSSVSQKPITNLPEELRLIRVMTPLLLEKEGTTYIPLTLRSEGATNAGQWGCSSKLLGQPLTPQFIKALSYAELEVSVDGAAFTQAELQLPEVAHTVNIHGGHANDSIQCFVYDNPTERVLTLVFPMVAKLPDGERNVANREHPKNVTQLFELADAQQLDLMPGLKQYLTTLDR